MKNRWKSLAAMILIVCVLSGTGPFAAADYSKDAFAEDVRDQSFALAMACWLGGFSGDQPDMLTLWDTAGWYAAIRQRIDSIDLLPAQDVEDFLRAMGNTGSLHPPESWEEYGVIRVLSDTAGNLFYDFTQHKLELQELLGVTTEVHVTADTKSPDTALATVTCHYSDDSSADWCYRLRFQENPDLQSAFPYRLTGLEVLPFTPNIEGASDFDWNDLMYANSLEILLMFQPSVHITGALSGDYESWFFRQDGKAAEVTTGSGEICGQLDTLSYACIRQPNGKARIRVNEIMEDSDAFGRWNHAVTGYLANIVNMHLVKTDGENCILRCRTRADELEEITVNRLTLALQKIDVIREDEQIPSVCFTYDEDVPAFPFLGGWKGAKRTVTLIWESYDGSDFRTWTEFVRVPADWEVYPWQAQRGTFTAYLDHGYTKQYQYPGDGIDYSIYLTTAKG